jgi:ubiquinone/menaquinone biosynthesis C-methylase UbiE
VANSSSTPWGSSYRLIAADKWKAKSAAMGQAVTEALVEYSRPRPGMNVIDLASGTGEPAISLALRVAPAGAVTAVDQSSELLKIAAERARGKNLQNFTTLQADAHTLPFPDHNFDLATCRFGIMFFSNVKQALSEWRRVLKPGARACFAAWGPIEQPFWQTTMHVIHRHVGGPLLIEGESTPFKFSAPGALSKALKDAGFQDVGESTQNFPWTWHGNSEEAFDYATSVAAPFRPMIERVPEDKWPAIRTEAYREIDKYKVGDEIRFGADVVMASGKA